MANVTITSALATVQDKAATSADKVKASAFAVAYYSRQEVAQDTTRAEKLTPCTPHLLKVCQNYVATMDAFAPTKNKVAQRHALAAVYFGLNAADYKALLSKKFFSHVATLGKSENEQALKALLKDATRGYGSIASLYTTFNKANSAANGKKGSQAGASESAGNDTLDNQLKSLFNWAAKNDITLPALKAAFDEKHSQASTTTTATIEKVAA
tara:strand:- start:739 stop:1374 length:636 start_codon:yes stop_codon:yes gene_type:complete